LLVVLDTCTLNIDFRLTASASDSLDPRQHAALETDDHLSVLLQMRSELIWYVVSRPQDGQHCSAGGISKM